MMNIDGNVFLSVEETDRERERKGDYPPCTPPSRRQMLPPHHYSSVNLKFPIKRDHTANMKYTLCVELLIKY